MRFWLFKFLKLICFQFTIYIYMHSLIYSQRNISTINVIVVSINSFTIYTKLDLEMKIKMKKKKYHTVGTVPKSRIIIGD